MSKYQPWLAKRPLLRRLVCLLLLILSPVILIVLIVNEHKAEIWGAIKEVAEGITDNDNQ